MHVWRAIGPVSSNRHINLGWSGFVPYNPFAQSIAFIPRIELAQTEPAPPGAHLSATKHVCPAKSPPESDSHSRQFPLGTSADKCTTTRRNSRAVNTAWQKFFSSSATEPIPPKTNVGAERPRLVIGCQSFALCAAGVASALAASRRLAST